MVKLQNPVVRPEQGVVRVRRPDRHTRIARGADRGISDHLQAVPEQAEAKDQSFDSGSKFTLYDAACQSADLLFQNCLAALYTAWLHFITQQCEVQLNALSCVCESSVRSFKNIGRLRVGNSGGQSLIDTSCLVLKWSFFVRLIFWAETANFVAKMRQALFTGQNESGHIQHYPTAGVWCRGFI